LNSNPLPAALVDRAHDCRSAIASRASLFVRIAAVVDAVVLWMLDPYRPLLGFQGFLACGERLDHNHADL